MFIAELTLFLMMKLTHFSSPECDGVDVAMETKYWRGWVCLVIMTVCVMCVVCGWWALCLCPVLLYILSAVRVSERVILVEGVGVFLTSSFCTGTTRQMFLPCTVVSNVCAYETVYKQRIVCRVGLLLADSGTESIRRLLTLFPTTILPLKDIQDLYNGLEQYINR